MGTIVIPCPGCCGTGACATCPGGLPLTFHVVLHGPACLEGVTVKVTFVATNTWNTLPGDLVSVACGTNANCVAYAAVTCGNTGLSVTAGVTAVGCGDPPNVQATTLVAVPVIGGDLDCAAVTGHSTTVAFSDVSSFNCNSNAISCGMSFTGCPCNLIGQNVHCELLP